MAGKDSIRARLVRAGCDVANAFRKVPEVDAETLREMLRADPPAVVLVDVRQDDERLVSVIPGAISQSQFDERAKSLAGKLIVAYCTAGYRSGAFAADLIQRGLQCANLKDGMLGWCHRGFELQMPTGEATYDVHVYSKAWNIVDPPYRGVW